MTNIAHTAAFIPRDTKVLDEQLRFWNLAEDIGWREDSHGQIAVYAKEGATSWPMEWTPAGDDLFEAFEIADFLHVVAQPGQTIRTFDSGGGRGVYISRGVAPGM